VVSAALRSWAWRIVAGDEDEMCIRAGSALRCPKSFDEEHYEDCYETIIVRQVEQTKGR
jgi:hypothetical protein